MQDEMPCHVLEEAPVLEYFRHEQPAFESFGCVGIKIGFCPDIDPWSEASLEIVLIAQNSNLVKMLKEDLLRNQITLKMDDACDGDHSLEFVIRERDSLDAIVIDRFFGGFAKFGVFA